MSLIAEILGESHQKLLRPSGGCHNCPRKRIDFVPATLREGKILVLGEAPGKTEVEEQEGFTGASGQLLRSSLREVGIPLEYVSFSNTVHCRPPDNATPTAKEISCCLSQFVLDEIRGYPIVVLAGGTPLKALFPNAKGNRFRGNVAWHPDFPGTRFFSIYHPAYILRRKDMEGEFRQQIERLGRIYQEPEGQAPFSRLLRDPTPEFHEALDQALASPMISFDIETNRLESWYPDAEIRSFALTHDGDTVLFVHEDDTHFLGVLHKVGEFLQKPEKHVVGMNTGFDLDWVEEELDIHVACQIHDVATIFYEAKQYKMPSLKELVAKELDGYRYLVYEPSEEKNLELLSFYNAEDVVYPLQLFQKGVKEVTPRTRDMLFRVSGPSGFLLRNIQKNGFYLRQEYWHDKILEYKEREQKALTAWREEDQSFVPTVHDSGKGLHEYLFDLHKLPVIRTTDKGAPQVDSSAIKQWIRDGHEQLRHLLELRRIEKIRSTYLDAYRKHLGPDGRIHSSYTNTFTDSVRSSSRTPNLQNIPRDREIRNLFGVPPGAILMESDFSQIEFRIMVCLARDPTGIAAYQKGEDAHTTTARSFADGQAPSKEQRSWAKVINFSLLYGGDAYKVQQWARDQYGLDWSIGEAQGFVDDFWQTYTALPEYHKLCDRELTENRGWFESVTGHRFYYQDWDHPDQGRRDHIYRAHLNARAQGPAAQICFLTGWHALRLMRERGLGEVKFVNTVHDSLISEIPEPKLVGPTIAAIEEAKDIAYEWVKDWFIVPLVMEHEVGEAWGSLKEVKFTKAA